MGLVILRHKVAEFATWKRAFDGHAPARAEAGFSNVRVYSSADNSSDVVVLLDTDDIGKAKQFIASPELKSAMSAAGVVDKPDVFVLIPADAPDCRRHDRLVEAPRECALCVITPATSFRRPSEYRQLRTC